MSNIDRILADEGAAAEKAELADLLPSDVRVDRPNLGRPVVVSVRLSGVEHEQIRQAADEANLPVSTLLRLWALDRLRSERGSIEERLERLEQQVFQRTA